MDRTASRAASPVPSEGAPARIASIYLSVDRASASGSSDDLPNQPARPPSALSVAPSVAASAVSAVSAASATGSLWQPPDLQIDPAEWQGVPDVVTKYMQAMIERTTAQWRWLKEVETVAYRRASKDGGVSPNWNKVLESATGERKVAAWREPVEGLQKELAKLHEKLDAEVRRRELGEEDGAREREQRVAQLELSVRDLTRGRHEADMKILDLMRAAAEERELAGERREAEKRALEEAKLAAARGGAAAQVGAAGVTALEATMNLKLIEVKHAMHQLRDEIQLRTGQIPAITKEHQLLQQSVEDARAAAEAGVQEAKEGIETLTQETDDRIEALESLLVDIGTRIESVQASLVARKEDIASLRDEQRAMHAAAAAAAAAAQTAAASAQAAAAAAAAAGQSPDDSQGGFDPAAAVAALAAASEAGRGGGGAGVVAGVEQALRSLEARLDREAARLDAAGGGVREEQRTLGAALDEVVRGCAAMEDRLAVEGAARKGVGATGRGRGQGVGAALASVRGAVSVQASRYHSLMTSLAKAFAKVQLAPPPQPPTPGRTRSGSGGGARPRSPSSIPLPPPRSESGVSSCASALSDGEAGGDAAAAAEGAAAGGHRRHRRGPGVEGVSSDLRLTEARFFALEARLREEEGRRMRDVRHLRILLAKLARSLPRAGEAVEEALAERAAQGEPSSPPRPASPRGYILAPAPAPPGSAHGAPRPATSGGLGFPPARPSSATPGGGAGGYAYSGHWWGAASGAREWAPRRQRLRKPRVLYEGVLTVDEGSHRRRNPAQQSWGTISYTPAGRAAGLPYPQGPEGGPTGLSEAFRDRFARRPPPLEPEPEPVPGESLGPWWLRETAGLSADEAEGGGGGGAGLAGAGGDEEEWWGPARRPFFRNLRREAAASTRRRFVLPPRSESGRRPGGSSRHLVRAPSGAAGTPTGDRKERGRRRRRPRAGARGEAPPPPRPSGGALSARGSGGSGSPATPPLLLTPRAPSGAPSLGTGPSLGAALRGVAITPSAPHSPHRPVPPAASLSGAGPARPRHVHATPARALSAAPPPAAPASPSGGAPAAALPAPPPKLAPPPVRIPTAPASVGSDGPWHA
eukprot:tig00001365_g8358.t1